MQHLDRDALERFFQTSHEQLRDNKVPGGFLDTLERWETRLSKCRMSLDERRRVAAVFDALRDAMRDRAHFNIARERWEESVELLGTMTRTWQPEVAPPMPQDAVVGRFREEHPSNVPTRL